MKALFLIALIATCAYSTQVMDIFKDLAVDDYSRSLIVNIQIQLESGANVDTLTQEVKGVQVNLKQQLADGESAHTNQDDACTADLAELESGFSQAEADLFALEGLFTMDQTTLNSRREEIANKESEMTDRVAMAGDLTGQREKEATRFNAVVAENQQVFGLLASVRDIIHSTFDGAEFLEVKTSMKSSLVHKLSNFKTSPKGLAHGYNGFFKLMAQILAKTDDVHTDTTITDNILAIVDRIEENLEVGLASERHAESERKADYEELFSKVQGQIAYLQGNLNDLAQVCSSLEDRIYNQQAAFDAATESHADYHQRIVDREAECAAYQAVFENFYNNITAELSTVAKIMYQLTDKHALLARYGL